MREPVCGPDEVLMRTEAVSICSTDVSYFRGHLSPGQWPIIPGHEYVGKVVEIGSRVEAPIRPGDRLVYWGQTDFGGMAEFRAIRPLLPNQAGETSWYTERNFYDADQAAAIVVPETVPSRLATLVEPLTSVLRSLLVNPPRPGDVCVVLGAGPSGLLATQVLDRLLGAGAVTVIDKDPERIRTALSLGATHGFDIATQSGELKRLVREHRDHFADYVFDALPHVATVDNGDDVRRMGMSMLRPGGTYVIYGATELAQPIHTWMILAKGLQVRATPFDVRLFPMSRSAHVARIALTLIESGVIQAESLITDVVPATDEDLVVSAFAGYGARGSLKTSLCYSRSTTPIEEPVPLLLAAGMSV
ncbi:zinc-dependent alcohol dehydrogenase [Sphaerisporangium aureirubrum]|uniref:Zinc-binding dehydrogenase n=1 Tax=Sphaerisporangium aureirubrum TaxID=1544736 RepID=A0ABW1NRD0_9ACTN